MIDTVRIAELNNELGVVQEGIERATQRRHAIVTELVALLDGHDTDETEDAGARPASSTTTPDGGVGPSPTPNAHETGGDCQPTATRPPTDPRFRINGGVPAGYVEGLGE